MDIDQGQTMKEKKQIEMQIDLLTSAREVLSEGLAKLASRLSPALRDVNPSEDKEKTEVAKSLVGIATEIRSIRYCIEADTKNVMDILERLEI